MADQSRTLAIRRDSYLVRIDAEIITLPVVKRGIYRLMTIITQSFDSTSNHNKSIIQCAKCINPVIPITTATMWSNVRLRPRVTSIYWRKLRSSSKTISYKIISVVVPVEG